jgi:hypothetical protein
MGLLNHLKSVVNQMDVTLLARSGLKLNEPKEVRRCYGYTEEEDGLGTSSTDYVVQGRS